VANAYTDIASGTSLGLNLVKTGYEKLVAFQLRSEPLFRRVADTKATALTNPGTTVTFNLYNDLTADTTTLSETVIPDSVAVPSTSTVNVTLNEFGKTVIPTLLVRTFTFSDIDPAVANLVARDMAESIDLRVRAILDGGTNKVAATGATSFNTSAATNTITGSMLFSAGIGQFITARFRSNNALESMPQNTFGAFIHPDVAYDFMAATSAGQWRYPHENVAPENLWLQRVGVFGGVSYIETPRVKKAQDGSGGTLANSVYRTYFFAKQAIAEVVAREPHLIIGPVTDPMERFRPLSWYGIAGWNNYRQAALWRAETGSSIAAL
jgi:N4-gp56 family major capsid protein